MRTHPEVLLTSVDSDRLARLTADALRRPPEVEALDEVLRTARVVEPRDVPANVVTMNSRVTFRDEDSQRVYDVRLVYPREADFANQRLSVLTPFGSALLGLREGEATEFVARDGTAKHLRVLKVAFQPEASGRFEL